MVARACSHACINVRTHTCARARDRDGRRTNESTANEMDGDARYARGMYVSVHKQEDVERKREGKGGMAIRTTRRVLSLSLSLSLV